MRKIISFMAFCAVVFGMAFTASAEAYEVQKGDSLWKIAQDHDTTVSSLMEINNLKSITIHPKQVLEIGETHVVEKGDTLSQIGKDFDVTVNQIKEWNHLTSDLIVVGQELGIYPGVTVDSRSKEAQETATKATEQKSTATTEDTESTSSSSTDTVEGETLSVVATAYTAECEGCSGITYTGIDLNKDRNAKVIAVDPDVIPLGSEVYVEGYGHAIAGDIGGAIKGNKIDIHVPTKEEAYEWGVRNVEVTVLD